MDSHTRFSPEHNLISIQGLGHPKLFPILIHFIFLLCGSTAFFITLVNYSQLFYIAEVYSNSIQFWALTNPKVLLRLTPLHYIAELIPDQTHCWCITYLTTFLSLTMSCYIVDLWSMLIWCCGLPTDVFDSQSESSVTSPNSTIKNDAAGLQTENPTTTCAYMGKNLGLFSEKGIL